MISPLLANIFLHYAFDLWVRDWRRQATGDVIVVRYADDFIVGFQHEREARRFWTELRDRLAAHGLELHPDKVRAKLKEIKAVLRFRWHDPVPEVGRWLALVIRGHMNY